MHPLLVEKFNWPCSTLHLSLLVEVAVEVLVDINMRGAEGGVTLRHCTEGRPCPGESPRPLLFKSLIFEGYLSLWHDLAYPNYYQAELSVPSVRGEGTLKWRKDRRVIFQTVDKVTEGNGIVF